MLLFQIRPQFHLMGTKDVNKNSKKWVKHLGKPVFFLQGLASHHWPLFFKQVGGVFEHLINGDWKQTTAF